MYLQAETKLVTFCPLFLRLSAFDVAPCFLTFDVIVNKTRLYEMIPCSLDVDDEVLRRVTRNCALYWAYGGKHHCNLWDILWKFRSLK